MGKLSACIREKYRLAADIKPFRKISAEINDKHHLSAVIYEKYTLAAEIKPMQRISAEIRLPTIIREGDTPVYDGEYEFTPTMEKQIVETRNKLTTQDIIINPIPKNYGLITWNGHHLMIS